MSQKNKNFDQKINEEINKPITSRQKRKNNIYYLLYIYKIIF